MPTAIAPRPDCGDPVNATSSAAAPKASTNISLYASDPVMSVHGRTSTIAPPAIAPLTPPKRAARQTIATTA